MKQEEENGEWKAVSGQGIKAHDIKFPKDLRCVLLSFNIKNISTYSVEQCYDNIE